MTAAIRSKIVQFLQLSAMLEKRDPSKYTYVNRIGCTPESMAAWLERCEKAADGATRNVD